MKTKFRPAGSTKRNMKAKRAKVTRLRKNPLRKTFPKKVARLTQLFNAKKYDAAARIWAKMTEDQREQTLKLEQKHSLTRGGKRKNLIHKRREKTKVTRLNKNPSRNRGQGTRYVIAATLRRGAEMFFTGNSFKAGLNNAERFGGHKAVYGAMQGLKYKLPYAIVSIRAVKVSV